MISLLTIHVRPERRRLGAGGIARLDLLTAARLEAAVGLPGI